MGAGLLQEGRARRLSDADIVATLTALSAASIADAYRRFAPAPISDVILGGGGTRNPTFVRMLRERLDPLPVMMHEDVGIDSDNKEALVFALLAHETWYARPGTHPTLTGARHATVLGQITPGDNYADLLRKTWCAG
jgi:anhydro-N-acetylmuramic acid kinase